MTDRYPEETYQLKLTVPTADADRLTTWLSARGVDEWVEDDVNDLDIDFEYGERRPEIDIYENLPARDVFQISLYKFDRAFLEGVAREFRNEFGSSCEAFITAISTKSWTEGWKESFQPFETGKFVVLPPWRKEDLPNFPRQKIPLIIEPGMAFGTGQHETTQLCLTALEELDVAGKKCLDVGTGTGILAIGALKLGASKVAATDIDPDALIAAQHNIEMNDAGNVQVEQGSFPEKMEEYDIVLANILAHVLKRLIPAVAQRVAESGTVVLSGLLVQDEAEILSVCRTAQLSFVSRHIKNDWLALVVKKA